MAADSLGTIPTVHALVWDSRRRGLGYEQMTGMAASSTPTVPSGTVSALVQAELGDVRWRDDGTAPTVAAGMLLVDGDTLWFTGDFDNLRFIDVATGAKVNLSYYGVR